MSYKDWIKCKISDLGDVVSGGTPSTKIVDNWDGEISWITPKDLSGFNNRFISTGERKISDKGLANSSAKLMPKGSVLFSSRAPIGYVAIASKELSTNQGFKSIVPNGNNYNIFIYYLLKYITDDIKSIAGGSTFSEISGTAFKNIEIKIPKLNEQKAIANILSSLDDKIELNNKINKTLEELAQTLYKRWFVDFEFPNEYGEPYKSSGGKMVESELGLIPEDWDVKDIIELITFIGGSQPPKKEHIYEPKEGYIRFIQNRDYSGNDKHLTYIKNSNRNKLCTKHDIMMDKYGEAGKVRYGIEGAYNVALAKIDCEIEHRELLRKYFEQENIQGYILNSSQASTRPSVNASVFTNLKIAMPPINLLSKFNKFTIDIINNNLSIQKQNNELSNLRDLLLPKLMSGEIRVPIKE